MASEGKYSAAALSRMPCYRGASGEMHSCTTSATVIHSFINLARELPPTAEPAGGPQSWCFCWEWAGGRGSSSLGYSLRIPRRCRAVRCPSRGSHPRTMFYSMYPNNTEVNMVSQAREDLQYQESGDQKLSEAGIPVRTGLKMWMNRCESLWIKSAKHPKFKCGHGLKGVMG